MKQGTTNIKIVYKPLNTSVSTTFLSGNPKQTFDSDSDTFQPDRRIDPLTIKVNCLVSDTYGFVDGSVNASLTDISWKILDSNGVSTDIISTNKNYKIGTGAEKGQLRVFQNVDELAPITIVFTASYLEPKSKRIAKFQESINLSTITSSATPLQLDTDMPMGGALYVTKDTDRLLARGRLFRGKDEVPASYYWYDANGNELTDTNGITGSKTKMISIPSTQISKSGSVVKLEVGDESDYYNSLLDDAVMNDTQVVEWVDLDKNNNRNLFLNSKCRMPVNWGNGQIVKTSEGINFKNCTSFVAYGGGVVSQPLQVGEEYTISIMYRTENTPATDFHWYINTSNSYKKINSPDTAGQWKVISDTRRIETEGWVVFNMYVPQGIVTVAWIVITKGNKGVQEWSPALDDINNLITQKKKDYATLDKQVIEWQNLMYKYGRNLFLNSKGRMPLNWGNGQVVKTSEGINFQNCTTWVAYGVVVSQPLQVGEEYTISIMYRTENTPAANFHWYINDSNSYKKINSPDTAGQWKVISDTRRIETNGGVSFNMYVPNRNVTVAWIVITKGNKGVQEWSPALDDINNLIASTSENPDIPVKLPNNYRPSTKPSKVYKADFLMIKRYPSYTEEVLITQGGIDASATSVQVEMIIKTNDGVLQNPDNYFSVKWYKQSNGTYKYNGFKVNVSMEDIIALQSTGAELDYELTEIK